MVYGAPVRFARKPLYSGSPNPENRSRENRGLESRAHSGNVRAETSPVGNSTPSPVDSDSYSTPRPRHTPVSGPIASPLSGANARCVVSQLPKRNLDL